MEIFGAVIAILALLILLTLLFLLRQYQTRSGVDPVLDARLRELAAAQNEIAGRFGHAIETQIQTHGDLQRTLAERLEALDQRLGSNLKENSEKTAESLGGLQTRLKVIDEAQKNLSDLSGKVVSLQQVLTNKQERGAYGQGQMENIIRDALPAGLYEFQATLSNNSRPDCLIRLPNTKSSIVIDSKFPLECFELYKNASTDMEKRAASARVRNDMVKHIKDISEKYLLPGETQDPALMFIPSESVYAELHDSFSDLFQQAQRARVIIVSPNILLLAVNTVQTVLKDARMREQADLIQREVGLMQRDVELLGERVAKLQTHFGQADADMRNILTSADRISKRAERIEQVELVSPTGPDLPSLPPSGEPDSC